METFDALLELPPGVQVNYITVPFLVVEVFGSKARVNVKGTIDGLPYASSIAPIGDGTHVMMVTKAQLAQIGKTTGDTIHVMMELDTEERQVSVPEDFSVVLAANTAARTNFDAFSYTHRKDYVSWIESAKKPETRAKRIQEALERLAAGQKFR